MSDQAEHVLWMEAAIAQARAGISAGQSPFGAVIVRQRLAAAAAAGHSIADVPGEPPRARASGELIAAAHNEVWAQCDPTVHAEVLAIRRAAAALGRIDLSGCVIYSTCEPCPMCAAAIHWARLDAVVYGAAIADAERGGFRELRVSATELYARGGSGVRVIAGVGARPCAALFEEWRARGLGRPY